MEASVDIDCDFDQSFCNWSVNDKDKFKRWNGKGPHFNTGPPSDHTTGEGYYALCDGTFLNDENDSCEMFTSVSNDQAKLKFTFWYYYYGAQLQSLKLMKDNTVLWTTSTQVKAWVKAEIDLPIGTYTVSF